MIAYDIRSGKVAKSKDPDASEEQIKGDLRIFAYNSVYNIVPNDISSWNVNTALKNNDNYKFGDYYFYRYIYTFKDDGSIKQIQENDNYKSVPSDPY